MGWAHLEDGATLQRKSQRRQLLLSKKNPADLQSLSTLQRLANAALDGVASLQL